MKMSTYGTVFQSPWRQKQQQRWKEEGGTGGEDRDKSAVRQETARAAFPLSGDGDLEGN